MEAEPIFTDKKAQTMFSIITILAGICDIEKIERCIDFVIDAPEDEWRSRLALVKSCGAIIPIDSMHRLLALFKKKCDGDNREPESVQRDNA